MSSTEPNSEKKIQFKVDKNCLNEIILIVFDLSPRRNVPNVHLFEFSQNGTKPENSRHFGIPICPQFKDGKIKCNNFLRNKNKKNHWSWKSVEFDFSLQRRRKLQSFVERRQVERLSLEKAHFKTRWNFHTNSLHFRKWQLNQRKQKSNNIFEKQERSKT